MKRFSVLITILILLIAAAGGIFYVRHEQRLHQPQQIGVSPSVQDLLEPTHPKPKPETTAPLSPSQPTVSTKTETIPAKAFVRVPFIVQAPFSDWAEPYQDACEEASVLMVHHFYLGTPQVSKDQAKAEIDAMTTWGMKVFASSDTTVAQTVKYFTDDLGYDEKRVVVVYDQTIDDMKAILAKGYPVIVPAAGRELGNKNFHVPGPLYHMLVLVGYDGDQIITNDPGTRNGEGFRYNQNVLYAAIHDLTPDKEQITTGRKAMIVVKPL